MLKMTRAAVLLFAVFTLLTGVVYPLTVTGVAQLFFLARANGSILGKDGKPVGSALIGQQFDAPGYFWGRPSATAPYPYNAAASSGSNLGQNNPALLAAVRERAARLQAADPGGGRSVPAELVTASASGLDPHISPAAAAYQVRRVAAARGLEAGRIQALVLAATEERVLGILGEPRINVLRLNLALDEVKEENH